MVKIILVNKNASLTEKSVKNFELATLYKKCSLKSVSNFDKRHTWNVNSSFYSVYAKDNGRANSENKYVIMDINHILQNIKNVLDDWESYGYYFFIGKGVAPSS